MALKKVYQFNKLLKSTDKQGKKTEGKHTQMYRQIDTVNKHKAKQIESVSRHTNKCG